MIASVDITVTSKLYAFVGVIGITTLTRTVVEHPHGSITAEDIGTPMGVE